MRLPTSKTRPALLTLYRDIVCVDEGGGDVHDSPRTMIVCASSRIDASKQQQTTQGGEQGNNTAEKPAVEHGRHCSGQQHGIAAERVKE